MREAYVNDVADYRQRLPLPVHVAHAVLLGLGTTAALWQHGHPSLTLWLLAAALPVSLAARLPVRWFPSGLRQLGQAGVGIAAVCWTYSRLRLVAPDLALAEGIGLLALALAVRGTPREYARLAALSLVLVGYGGVAPARPVYVPATALYVGVGVLVLYQTRTARLAAGERVYVEDAARLRAPLGVWGCAAAHFAVFLALWYGCWLVLPVPRHHSRGIVPVSFRTRQSQRFSMLLGEWLRSGGRVRGRRGRASLREGDHVGGIDQTGVRLPEDLASRRVLSSRQGTGVGATGRDLVCRVQCAEKLYWLARIYDVYDGRVWRTSRWLRKRPGTPVMPADESTYRQVEQWVSIEKAVSPAMLAAFRVHRYLWESEAELPSPSTELPVDPRFRLHLSGGVLNAPLPPLPWRYQCGSWLPAAPDGRAVAPWADPAPRSHYRRAPQALISDRLRGLARRLADAGGNDFETAMAAREYLRGACEYTLDPPTIPADRESVDHFLFESKRGYCVHFAEALTVLARLCGLPARIGAGYLPGNYNVLTGSFEVFEYHAHAWSQVFVEPHGWLTFDGVPPADLPLRTVPILFGKLRDPFRDEWDARPPELAKGGRAGSGDSVASATTPQTEEDAGAGGLARALNQIVEKATRGSGESVPDAVLAGRFALAGVRVFWQGLRRAGRAWLTEWRARIARARASLGAFVGGMAPGEWVLAVGLAVSACALFLMRWALWGRYRRWRRRRRCDRLWAEIQSVSRRAPSQALGPSLVLARELLDLAGLGRPDNWDAAEYADWVAAEKPRFGTPLREITQCVTRQLFSPRAVGDQEALGALRSLRLLRAELAVAEAADTPG